MMNKAKSPVLKPAEYLWILSLAFLLIVVNSCVSHDKKSDKDVTIGNGATVLDSKDSTYIFPGEIGIVYEDSNQVFVVVEERPEFPGRDAALLQFLSDNIKYPAEAQEKGIQGRVICRFVVMKDGSIDEVEVVRGVHPSLDAEAMRVLELMPKWGPGMQRGQAVNVRFTLPVVFRLNKEEVTREIVTEDIANPAIPSPVKVNPSNEVFMVVEEQPEFPGGNAAMMKWLSDNIKYPVVAQDNRIQGRVIVNFVVEKDGSLSDIQVVRSVDPSLDKEAVRVVRTMPKWKPGIQRDERVRVRYTLPVVFRLQN